MSFRRRNSIACGTLLAMPPIRFAWPSARLMLRIFLATSSLSYVLEIGQSVHSC